MKDGEDIGTRVSPPYDVIDSEYLEKLMSDEHNVTHLTLNPVNGRPLRVVNQELGFGYFFEGATNGICVLPLPPAVGTARPRPTRTRYFFRTEPSENTDGTFTAASRQRGINVAGQQRPPSVKVRNGKTNLRAGMYVKTAAGEVTYYPERMRAFTVETGMEFWQAATVRRPAGGKFVWVA